MQQAKHVQEALIHCIHNFVLCEDVDAFSNLEGQNAEIFFFVLFMFYNIDLFIIAMYIVISIYKIILSTRIIQFAYALFLDDFGAKHCLVPCL